MWFFNYFFFACQGRHETPVEQGIIKLAVTAYAVRMIYKAAQNKDIVVAFLSNMCFIIPDDDDYGKQPEKVQ